MVSRGKRRAGRMAAVLVVIASVVGMGGVTSAAQAAEALYSYSQGFETDGDARWYWSEIGGGGSGEWNSVNCSQARRGCGGVVMRHPPTGWLSLAAQFRIGGFANGGTCQMSYWARLFKSTGPAIARLEVIRPSDWTYIVKSDLQLTTGSWEPNVAAFLQGGARDVVVRITLPGSGSTSNRDVGINVDDFKFSCGPIINGR